jgi:pimeloyl-ACP methyl ester carboxylesterase
MLGAFEPFEELVQAIHWGATFEEVRSRFESPRLPAVYRERELILFPDDEELWRFLLRIFDYDPRSALAQIGVPVLALFGANDPLVSVEASVKVYREAVKPELLTVEIFPDADHRIQVADPPRLADGYLDTLTRFVLQQSA